MMLKVFSYFILTPLLFADIFSFQTIEKANEAYENGEYRKSIRLFKSLNRDDPMVVYDQANAAYKAGMYDEALKYYANAKGVDEATRLYNMGNCYFQKGDYIFAVEKYRVSLKLRSDDDVRYNLKLARKKQEEKTKKKDKVKKDKKQNPKDNNKKESNEKNSKSQKDANASKKQETKKKMTAEEKMRKKELSHLIKQLNKKKMPTMMYQGKENKEEQNDKNPW